MNFFNRIRLQTPESVEIEFTLAGIGNRALALLIDYCLLGLTLFLFVLVWAIFSFQFFDLVNNWTKNADSLGLWLLAFFFLLMFFIYAGYFVFFETLWQGQTPGKRFAKIRVIRDDGRPVGLAQATLRSLLRPLDEFLYIGAFFIMFSRQEKRLGDWAAGTIVIESQIVNSSSTFTISEQADTLYAQLLEIADLSQLLPDDFAVIREYLQRRNAMTQRSRIALAAKLTQQVVGIIKLDKLPQANPDVFLEAVYLAYQHKEY
ncbi:RDD family protein [Nostoc sp. FACHB-110]|uniref:RDD family protein n=1 Tax=Nostoc sp. FACHB-110 TaxID=2692834 RepID=UPI0016882DBB|nr:RDD family protein [Nostoc sp. FACHB-110]MBD2438317.1 RDD family protein [Nostoc sp. FACHB-110]